MPLLGGPKQLRWQRNRAQKGQSLLRGRRFEGGAAQEQAQLHPGDCWGLWSGIGGSAIAPLLLLMALVFTAKPGMAQTVVRPLDHPPGLCTMGQRDMSGRWINDGTGEMVPITMACEVARQVYESPDLSPESTRFWSAFVTAASPEAIAFAESFEADAVVAYGKAVCASLWSGESIDSIRQIQQDGGLPVAFEAAVTVAAIHAYCPGNAGVIGR